MKSRLTLLICGVILLCSLVYLVGENVEAAPRGRRVLVEATAYSPQDPGLSNTTATGTRLRKGVIAVDPDFIPLGSRVYIPDYGEAVAEDTGGAIVGNVIDVAFNTHAEALDFGRQEMYIYLLDEEESAPERTANEEDDENEYTEDDDDDDADEKDVNEDEDEQQDNEDEDE